MSEKEISKMNKKELLALIEEDELDIDIKKADKMELKDLRKAVDDCYEEEDEGAEDESEDEDEEDEKETDKPESNKPKENDKPKEEVTGKNMLHVKFPIFAGKFVALSKSKGVTFDKDGMALVPESLIPEVQKAAKKAENE